MKHSAKYGGGGETEEGGIQEEMVIGQVGTVVREIWQLYNVREKVK